MITLLEHVSECKSGLVPKLHMAAGESEYVAIVQKYAALTAIEDCIALGQIKNEEHEEISVDLLADITAKLGSMDLSNVSGITECLRELNLRLSEHILMFTIYSEGLQDVLEENFGAQNINEEIIQGLIKENVDALEETKALGIPFTESGYASLFNDILESHGLTYEDYLEYNGAPLF